MVANRARDSSGINRIRRRRPLIAPSVHKLHVRCSRYGKRNEEENEASRRIGCRSRKEEERAALGTCATSVVLSTLFTGSHQLGPLAFTNELG